MKSEQLIESLAEQTKLLMKEAERLKTCHIEILNYREHSQSWSILECLEHLNLYGNYYLPEIDAQLKNSVTEKEENFRTGILGNYFAKSMLPKEKLNKMKTFKDKNPINSSINLSVIDRFLIQQQELLKLLNQSSNVSLNRIRIKTSISKLIRLRLGDTFQFIVNHNIRHFEQIARIESNASEKQLKVLVH